jgi:TPR repeat protein
MKVLCATVLAGAMLIAPSGLVRAEDQETPSWASTTWMAHDTTKQVQMAYRYAQSYDYEKALEHLRVAARRGYPQAQAQVGYYYQEGLGGLETDSVEAVKWYLLSDIPTAVEYAKKLRGSMTEQQYEDAEARAAAWEPVLE